MPGPDGDVVRCQTCQGNGKINKEIKPGKWKEIKCPAGCRNGKISKRLL